jgi:L-ascorbate metabolism protein UlaG (beta-lactamase superfamily)
MADDLGFRFTWYGHSCVVVETPGGTRVIFDPWFSNPRSPKAAADVNACDVMLVTHGHFDHLGGQVGHLEASDAITIARRTEPVWPCIHELSLWLPRVLRGKAEVMGMNQGGTFDARGLPVTMVRADHSAGDWGSSANSDTSLSFGSPVGFIVELENGRRIYHAGDTDVFGDMALIGEMHQPDLAFLPIGGHFTMGPRGAARAVELLGVKKVVPIHWGTFPLLPGTADQFRAELAQRGLNDVEVISPEPGETV